MKTDFLTLLAARIAGVVCQGITIVLVARKLGVVSFGQLSVAITFVTIFMVIAELGLTPFLTKSYSQGDIALSLSILALNRWAAWLAAFGSIPVTWLILGSNQSALFGSAALCIGASLEKICDVICSIPISDGRALAASKTILLRRISGLVVTLILLQTVDGSLAYCLGILAAGVIGTVISLHFSGGLSPSVERSSVLFALRQSQPYFWANLSVQSRMLDVILVNSLLSRYDAGLYSAASRLASPFMLIPGTLSAIVLPRASRSGREYGRRLGTRLLLLGFLCSGVGAVSAIIFRGVVSFVLGPQFEGAISPLVALFAFLPFVAVSSPLGSLLQGIGREKVVATSGVAFAILGLATCSVGAVTFGATGAAVGMGSSYVLKCFYLESRIRRGE